MEKIRRLIPTLIFNIAETLIIFLCGICLKLEIRYVLLIMLVFMMSRGFFGKALHFKTWYRCLIWSTLIMLSLFVLLKVDLIISILFAIFSAFIMTGKSNIEDMYMWNNGEPSKYADILDFIKYHPLDDKLLEFEEKLKSVNTVEYLIYKYRFKENKTFAEISELLDLDNPRIVEKLDKVAFAIRIYCKI
ncbi:MAG: accessory gene regulator B family protein [Anaeroplasmataceae bacterium]|nr:accessory gene regulator B family protein [Anaeroplasmataceae bacterium]